MWWIKRILELPPRLLLRKAASAGPRAARHAARWARDRLRSSFDAVPSVGELRLRLRSLDVSAQTRAQPDWLAGVCQNYLEHRFDLLGSGWVRVRHGMACRGVEGNVYGSGKSVVPDGNGEWLRARINKPNLAESRRIWRLVDPGYEPIDWQLDIKSGYRWSEKAWYLTIPYGHLPGVDVKVPWELSRMHHFSQLAWASHAARHGGRGLQRPEAYAREFRNQVLDFIATNPPRFGVNWRCTMSVAIRAVNWLVAYDLFRAGGEKFDPGFERVFFASLYRHGRHIVRNLECSPEWRGNHYLADIVGLLFVAAYLPRNDETDGWLAFAAGEILREVEFQFMPDGSNFEASTSYHRLSTEMTFYATALLLGLDADRPAAFSFPAWYAERLERMVEFARHVMKPNHQVAQFGDNDNGRLLKTGPSWNRTSAGMVRESYANLHDYVCLPGESVYWEEMHLDHRHLLGAVRGLIDRGDFVSQGPENDLESALVRALSGGRAFGSCRARGIPGAESIRVGGERDWQDAVRAASAAVDDGMRHVCDVVIAVEGLWENLQLCAYPDFGLYLFRSRRVFLAIRCEPGTQGNRGAHAHNDQLSFELNVDGVDWVADPGTYLYTPLPERRNQYRSMRAHWGPRLVGAPEPRSFAHGLFRLAGAPAGKCLYFGSSGFAGRHDGFGQAIYRLFRLRDRGIEIVDWTDGPGRLETPLPSRVTEPLASSVPPSAGYGMRAAL